MTIYDLMTKFNLLNVLAPHLGIILGGPKE